jgi:hypothetical protein
VSRKSSMAGCNGRSSVRSAVGPGGGAGPAIRVLL